jgi:hypothetical protein
MKWSQWTKKIRTSIARPCHPPDRLPRNGKPIENPDSWRKIRGSAAMIYREDVWLLAVELVRRRQRMFKPSSAYPI